MEKLERRVCDLLVGGGGPAGMAAACAAARHRLRVLVVDDNPSLGGQIWRGENLQQNVQASSYFHALQKPFIDFLPGAHVVSAREPKCLIAETRDHAYELHFEKLILATGARERFLPFPGWTLPNVMGAGGLQALVTGGLPINKKRVVVAGSGPLLLAVAAHLRQRGAHIVLVAEQTSLKRLLRFGCSLIGDRHRLLQAFELKRELRHVPYLTRCWPIAAQGKGKLEKVQLRRGMKTWEVHCDYLACGFHLVPNVELPLLLGCRLHDDFVWTDEFQQTSVENVYCAGEPTGIGGVDLALIEGEIAGLAASGAIDEAQKLFPRRAKLQKFARVLNQTFALREELRQLAEPDTIVCRCEDVSHERLRSHDSWRAAKLLTRCGMGPCQGRVCGPATEFLFDWKVTSTRPPIFPARIDTLIRSFKEPVHENVIEAPTCAPPA